MPGHFLIKPDQPDMAIFVDPFHKGEIMFTEDCIARFAQLYGADVPFQAEYLAPVSKSLILTRILLNLKAIYFSQNDLPRALAVVERLLALNPQSLIELRDRGLLFYKLGCWPEALQDLEYYLNKMTEPDRMIEKLTTYLRDNQ